MASYQKFNSFVEALAEKVHNLGTDTLKLALTNVAPSPTDTVFANITEITPQFNYPAGGETVTITSSSQSGGLYALVGNDVTFSASGGSFGPFRYVVFYNSTATNDELISFYDNGSSITLNDGESFTVDYGTQILTIQ